MTLSELLKLIEEETRISSDWNNPDYLSNLLLRLASYYASLGRFIADSDLAQSESETRYRVKRDQTKKESLEGGSSVALADAVAELAIEDDKLKYNQLKYKARLVLLSRQSLDKTMDAIRSRLSYLKLEREAHDYHG